MGGISSSLPSTLGTSLTKVGDSNISIALSHTSRIILKIIFTILIMLFIIIIKKYSLFSSCAAFIGKAPPFQQKITEE